MREIEKITKILKEHKKELREHFSIKEIGIFGSYARRKETAKSDIDIYLDFYLEKLTFDKYLDLLKYLKKILKKRVDLITKDGVETIRIPYIKEDIKKSIVYV